MTHSSADKGKLGLMATFPVVAWAGITYAILKGAGKGPWSHVPDWLVALTIIAALISALLGVYIAIRALWIPAGRLTLWLGIFCGFALTPVLGLFIPAILIFF